MAISVHLDVRRSLGRAAIVASVSNNVALNSGSIFIRPSGGDFHLASGASATLQGSNLSSRCTPTDQGAALCGQGWQTTADVIVVDLGAYQ